MPPIIHNYQACTGTELRPFGQISPPKSNALQVVKLPVVQGGFVLLPRRWVVELSFGRMSRFRRLVRDYEQLSDTLAGLHYFAFVILMLKSAVEC
jgi:Transposase DDE domain